LKEQSASQDNSQRRRKHPRRRTRFRLLVAMGSVIALVVLAIVIDAALSYNKVHAGVSVSGVKLGSLTQDEAAAALTGYVNDAQANAITLKSGEKSWSLVPTEVGTKLFVEQAVSEAMDVSRKSDVFSDLGRRFKLYFSKTDIPLRGTVDGALLDAFLEGVARDLDVSPVNAGLSMENGKIKVVADQAGSVVDRSTLRAQLEGLLLSLRTAEVPVPMIAKEPDVKAEDHRAALERAQTMVSAPLIVANGDQKWSLTPEQIGFYMDFASEDQNGISTLVPYLSPEKLAPFFEEIAPLVANEPIDAAFDSDGTKAWVAPEILGEALDAEGTAEALTAAALSASDRTVEAAVKTTEPEFTTEEAEAMGIKDLLASYTTEPYRGSSNRQVNVRITTQYAGDKFLAPGEEYDFDKTIGPRTEERGYKRAPGIVGGGEMEDVLGGGICQVSTTLFNAVFEAGLEIVERWNHSLYISHYPEGRDATVAGGGGKNFRFRNDTDSYIWIRGTSDGITTTFNIYGTDGGRIVKASFSGFSYGASRTEVTIQNPSLSTGTTHVKISGQSGRSCSVTRTITYGDGTTRVETFGSYYPMIPKTIEVGPSTTTTTLTPPTTEPGTTSTLVTEFKSRAESDPA
jgi:vancomycin resistance protein YoaR